MATISRRKLSTYAADRIINGDAVRDVMNSIASYLIDTNRVREAELVVRDIEAKLLERGIAITTTVSARTLSNDAQSAIEKMIKQSYGNVTTVALREVIDPSVIGGVRVELPNARLDTTVKTKLERLGI